MVTAGATVLSPLGTCHGTLNDRCDYCVQEQRDCDGSGIRACSSCIAENRPICHYSIEATPPRRSRRQGNGGHRQRIAHGKKGTGLRQRAATVCEASGGVPAVSKMALKRPRLSASPATGLVGMPENGFLTEFFECLGFLSLVSQRIVRDAIVHVMLSGETTSQSPPQQQPAANGTAAKVGQDLVESNGQVDGCWDKAAPPPGGGELPRDPSTCLLWCAIALGALVRGCPLTKVDRYVDLAEDSLSACRGGTSFLTARAYFAMAYLHSFLGTSEPSGSAAHQQRKDSDYWKLGNDIVTASPREEVPQVLLDLAGYIGMLSGHDREPVLTETFPVDCYFNGDAPIRQLPSVLGHEGVRTFFIGSDAANNSLLGVVIVVATQMLSRQAAANGPSDSAGTEPREGVSGSTGKRLGERPHHYEASVRMLKGALPAMHRVQTYFDSAPDMRLGMGAIMFYCLLRIMQDLTHDAAGAAESTRRCLDLKTRYPGIFRHKPWTHHVHVLFWELASRSDRGQYEKLRAAYSSVQPAGSEPIPPYEEWRGLSDICKHPHAICRKLV